MADPTGGTAPPERGEPTEGRLVRVRSDDRRPLLAGVIVVAAILALAVLKPWADPGDPSRAVEADAPSAGPGGVAAAPGPLATPSATPPGYGAPGGQCYPGAAWRVFALETRTGGPIQHWLSIEPGTAASPRDPGVPLVSIVTDRLLALGFCVGSQPDDVRSSVEARAWTLAPGASAAPVALAPLVEYMPRQVDLGAIYQPPAGSPGEASAGWPPGRYVFAVRQGPGRNDELWFGVEVLAAPRVSATP